MNSHRFGALAMILAVTTSVCLPAFAQTPVSSALKLAPGESLGHALDILAVPNLRDIGGYMTSNGATVMRGLVYRSDNFNPMTAADIVKLEHLDLKNDYDLRTQAEEKAKPDQMPSGVAYHLLDVFADDKGNSPNTFKKLMSEPQQSNKLLGGGRIDAAIMQRYRWLISLPSAKKSYRSLFLSLADRRNLPATFHCTTGKDRTGWAAAALLTLLGVPEKTVKADYLRSNEYTLPQFKPVIDKFVAAGGDRNIVVAMLGVKPEYLQASFDEMHKEYGSIENYFSKGLGIDTTKQQALRHIFLVKGQ